MASDEGLGIHNSDNAEEVAEGRSAGGRKVRDEELGIHNSDNAEQVAEGRRAGGRVAGQKTGRQNGMTTKKRVTLQQVMEAGGFHDGIYTFTRKEAAKLLSMDPKTLRKYLKELKIPDWPRQRK